jgi:hypothetical protein
MLNLKSTCYQRYLKLLTRINGCCTSFLIESFKAEALFVTIEDIVDTEKSELTFEAFTDTLRDTLQERSSSKHIAGLDLGCLEATLSLGYRAAVQTKRNVTRKSLLKTTESNNTCFFQ